MEKLLVKWAPDVYLSLCHSEHKTYYLRITLCGLRHPIATLKKIMTYLNNIHTFL